MEKKVCINEKYLGGGNMILKESRNNLKKFYIFFNESIKKLTKFLLLAVTFQYAYFLGSFWIEKNEHSGNIDNYYNKIPLFSNKRLVFFSIIVNKKKVKFSLNFPLFF